MDEGEKNAVITAPYVAVYDAILSYEDVRIADNETLTTGADEALCNNVRRLYERRSSLQDSL